MAKEKKAEEMAADAELKKIQDEKKQLKREQKEQRKEAKRRAKEIAKREDALAEDEESSGFMTFGTTLLIVVLWLVVVCVIIKLDVGGFGSSVLTPVLKDVPVVNKILPGNSLTETTDTEAYGGYSSLKEAVEQIKELELQIDRLQTSVNAKEEEIISLKAEKERLQEFADAQTEFQRIRTKFYEEVVNAEKGPGVEEFKKYYEAMDPTTAEYIYKQIMIEEQESKEVLEYAETYSKMKPKAAAAIFEAMTDNLKLAARILDIMSAEERGAIMEVMDPDVAAKLTKMMDPES